MMPEASPEGGRYDTVTMYWRVFRYLRRQWMFFALSMFGFLLYASTQPALGSLMELFIDGLNGKLYDLTVFLPHEGTRFYPWVSTQSWWPTLLESSHSVKVAYIIPVLVILIYIVRGIGSFLGAYFMAKVGFTLVHTLRCEMFERLLALPNTYFDQNNSGHLITKFTFNVNQVTDAIARSSTVAVREGFTVVALMGALLWQSWRLTLVFLLLGPVIGLMVKLSGGRFKKSAWRIQRSIGDVAHVTKETVTSFNVVRSFGGERYEYDRFFEASDRNQRQQLKLVRARETYSPISQFLVAVAMAVMMYLALTYAHGMTAGELVAYVTMAGLLPKPLKQLNEVSGQIQRGMVAAEDVFRLIDEPAEDDAGIHAVARVQGAISLRHLEFGYARSESPVLNDVTLDIKPGEMVALVGHSGSGKTTLVSLIPRFYDAPRGSIFIDGIDIRDYSLKSLRRQIALVNQQVALFNDTIAHNIAYGVTGEPDPAAVQAAADAAFATEFINRLPQGMQTYVGENGLMLSGGQRQRLAIARALFKDAPILILDEATSALDTESERYIQGALETVMKGRTTLVIAHRLSTIERADKIVVMDKGRIVEVGTHASLLAQGGAYSKLYNLQFQESV